MVLGSFLVSTAEGMEEEEEGQAYLWAVCLSAGTAGCLAHCALRDVAAEPPGPGDDAERAELGGCQFLTGAPAAES